MVTLSISDEGVDIGLWERYRKRPLKFMSDTRGCWNFGILIFFGQFNS